MMFVTTYPDICASRHTRHDISKKWSSRHIPYVTTYPQCRHDISSRHVRHDICSSRHILCSSRHITGGLLTTRFWYVVKNRGYVVIVSIEIWYVVKHMVSWSTVVKNSREAHLICREDMSWRTFDMSWRTFCTLICRDGGICREERSSRHIPMFFTTGDMSWRYVVKHIQVCWCSVRCLDFFFVSQSVSVLCIF